MTCLDGQGWGDGCVPAVSILIKPASSACNLQCKYCFYRDVANHREKSYEGMLSLEMMETVIASAMEYAEGSCSFAFQGGEPTLAGLDFYQRVVKLEERYRRPGVEIHNAIQTNGICVDEAWAEFFAKHHFLVGLSLDGPAELHDRNRTFPDGKGSWSRVMRSVQILEKFHVDYNILCVVTGKNARSIQKIYQFFKKQRFQWLQFIPCLEPLDQQRGLEPYHLSAEEYGDFLIQIFDLWFQDLKKGHYVSVRHIDNWVSMLMGNPPEACNMSGRCSIQFVIEGDGGVYPCDFYVLDEWRLGTVGKQPLEEMERSEVARRFVEQSHRVPQRCKECPVYPICRNGCRRDREVLEGGEIDLNYYCQAYFSFFTQRKRELYQAVQLILNRQRNL